MIDPYIYLKNIRLDLLSHMKLPRHWIVILDHNIVQHALATELILNWIAKEIWKSDLPVQAKPVFNTQVLFVKPVSEPSWFDPDRSHMQKKGLINHELDRIPKAYKNT